MTTSAPVLGKKRWDLAHAKDKNPTPCASSDSADDFVRISSPSEGLRHIGGAIAIANQMLGIDVISTDGYFELQMRRHGLAGCPG